MVFPFCPGHGPPSRSEARPWDGSPDLRATLPARAEGVTRHTSALGSTHVHAGVRHGELGPGRVKFQDSSQVPSSQRLSMNFIESGASTEMWRCSAKQVLTGLLPI